MTKTERAIEHFEGMVRLAQNRHPHPELEFWQAALDALRLQHEAEKNEPLTLDELQNMIGQPVWCEDGNGNCCWCLVSSLYSKNGFVGAIDDSTGLWDGDYYGMTGNKKHGLHEIGWYAYRHPPKEG